MQAERAHDADLADLVSRGTAALEAGNLELALEKFQAVVAAFPDRPEGHNNLGAMYANIGRHAQAEACFTRVLEILPGNPNILFNRGLMCAHQGDYARAILDFEEALAGQPDDPEILNNLGVAAFLAGNANRARTHLEQALAQDPRHLNALLNLCDVEENLGESGAAIERCKEYLVQGNELPVRRRLMGLLLNRATVDLTQAQEQGQALVAMDPGDEDVRGELNRLAEVLPALKRQA